MNVESPDSSLGLLPATWVQLAGSISAAEPVVARALEAYRARPSLRSAAVSVQVLTAQLAPREVKALLDTLAPEERDLIEGIIRSRTGDLPGAIRLLDQAATHARTIVDDTGPWPLAELGRALCISGESAEGAAYLEEALLMARVADDHACAGRCLLQLGFLEGERRRSEAYAEHTRQGIAALRKAGDLRGEVLGLCNLGGALQSLGDPAAAAAAYDEALPVAQRHGWSYHEALILAGRAGLAYGRGDIASGVHGYTESAAILDRIGHHQQRLYQSIVWARCELECGQFAEARARSASLLAEAGGTISAHAAAQTWGIQAKALEALGDFPAACAARAAQVALLEELTLERLATARRVAAERYQPLNARRSVRIERDLRFELQARNDELARVLAAQQKLREEFEVLAITDMLTGLYNRRHLESELQRGLRLTARHRHPLSLIVLDIDLFKQINDRHGHPVGDEVLVALSGRVRARLRATDVIARWGGEEFCLLLPNTDLEGARELAEQIRLVVSTTPFDTEVGPIHVTASLGVVSVEQPGETLTRLVMRADAALYAAKTAGRNCVFMYHPGLIPEPANLPVSCEPTPAR